MRYHSHSPGPPLSEFVDFFWLAADGQADRKERILPSGTIELVLNLRDDEMRIHDPAQPARYRRFSGAVISGTYSRVFICDAMQHESILGVHFKPGGAFPFLGAPASELAGTHADLADLWGRPAQELRERLCAAVTPRERFQIMKEVLTGHLLRRPPRRHSALPIALGMFGPEGINASVRDVAREVGLSQRCFIKAFTAEVGLTPKLFCRLIRFQRAKTLAEEAKTFRLDRPNPKQAADTLDWAQIALTCGYFDQSHLIRDPGCVATDNEDGRMIAASSPRARESEAGKE